MAARKRSDHQWPRKDLNWLLGIHAMTVILMIFRSWESPLSGAQRSACLRLCREKRLFFGAFPSDSEMPRVQSVRPLLHFHKSWMVAHDILLTAWKGGGGESRVRRQLTLDEDKRDLLEDLKIQSQVDYFNNNNSVEVQFLRP